MKIEKNLSTKTFAEVEMGELFSCGEDFYLKTETVQDCNFDFLNAVCLSDGQTAFFPGDELINYYPNSKIVV